ncbi:MAG TPA: hypothetical protein VMC80_01805 [Patescibacteria group bacterium]|nr:hypothetical protein [Patescibacteria group bacterium]
MTIYPYAIDMNPVEYVNIREKFKKDAFAEGIGLRYNGQQQIMATVVEESKLLILTEKDFNGLDDSAKRRVALTLNVAKLHLNETRLREGGWTE